MAKKSPNPTDKHVGARVRMRRHMLGLSQEKLADAIGLTFQQVQKYEKGANRIGASRLQQIASVMQVPESFFFDGAPAAKGATPGFFNNNAPQPELVTQFLATKVGLDLVQGFMKLPEGKRRSVVNLVEAM